jgi:ubiquinone/menaquinone biosynthesis C-methylase UbiE
LLFKATQLGLECYGLDNSEGMLVEAKGKCPEAEFRLASFYEIPFSDGTFDYVVETNAVSGVDIEVEKVLLEMVRVCKVGGEIRIGDYARPARLTWMNKVAEKMLILFGDYANDYKDFFTKLGYLPQVEILGWGGMYQFIKVIKTN